MTLHGPAHRETPSRRRVRALLLAAILCLLPAGAAGHEGEGIDAGYAHIFATADASGVVAVELHILDTDDCGKFRATEIIAERDPALVSGDLALLEPCVFGGSVTLPETGRWMVTVWVNYDGHPSDIQLPVGFSGQPGRFERADWLHVEGSVAAESADNPWWRPSGTLTYAAIGLLIGTAIELARRRWMAGTSG